MQANKQSGFTLIELVMVIVILGILAATALPKFVNLKTEAAEAAAEGMGGALSSASAINQAAKLAGSSSASAVSSCTEAQALVTNFDTAKFTVAGTAPNCTVQGTAGSAKNWYLYTTS